MKFLKFSLFLLLTMIAYTSVHAQKVKIKDGLANVDDQDICTLKDDAVRRLSFSIYTLDDKEQLYFKWIDYGQFGYFEVYDADNLNESLFETDAITGYKKWIVKQLYAAEVLTASGLNEEKLQTFAKKMGKEHTRLREEQRQ